MAGEVRLELTHNSFRDCRATITLLPNIVGGPGLPWAAALPTTLACRRILASGFA